MIAQLSPIRGKTPYLELADTLQENVLDDILDWMATARGELSDPERWARIFHWTYEGYFKTRGWTREDIYALLTGIREELERE